MMIAFSLLAAGFLQGAQAANSSGGAENATGAADTAAAEATGSRGYRTLRLGTVQGGSSFALALSPNHKAAGYVTLNIAGGYRPALFMPGFAPRVIHTDGPGQGTGVNGLGEVVGWFQQGTLTQAFRWKFDHITTLPSLGGGSSYAAAINHFSEIVGWSEVAPGVRHAAYWRGGTVVDLGAWGGVAAQATAINRRGDIVGWRELDVAGERVRQGVRQLKGQRPQLLRIPAGFDNLVPSAINDNGDIAGHMYPAGQELFASVGFLLSGNFYKRLTAEPGFPTFGLALNNLKEVAGYKFEGTADPRARARVWRNSGNTSVALDRLPSAVNTGWWALGDAHGINDSGVIVGVGQFNTAGGGRNIEAYMLVPR
ncbi:hypothetical protein [Azohydromonas aeria]|uniref:hypothetical protein n=1 Tax=Azohydromonas aeria TaxID=2590212 RepID=UPI001E2F6AF9|nr:hypothetical protein [Azohydromonas aeria]